MTKIRICKKKWIVLFAIEAVILLIFGFLYSKREKIELSFAQETLVYSNGLEGFYLDNSQQSRFICTPEFTLPCGLYTVNITYEKYGDAVMEVVYTDESFKSKVSGDIPAVDSDGASCDFRVSYSNRPIQIRGRTSETEEENYYLLIRNISISESRAAVRNRLLYIFLFFCLLNIVILCLAYRNQIYISKEKRQTLGILAILIFLSSIPIMVDYLTEASHDLQFHLMRIEGIKTGLEQGMFPVKIQPNWMNGYGYAASVFYGDVFLYIPAFLRFCGVSIQAAYRLYILLVNIATVFSVYYCFSRMGSKKTAIICVTVYTFNIYRLACIYTRAAVGEYTAMAFLPIVLYGLWRIYTEDDSENQGGKSWGIVALGCACIAFCHMISCEMVALFIVLTCLILWKKTIQKRIFWKLVKAAISTLLLVLWFFVPVLDYLKNGVYGINSSESYNAYALEEGASFLAQLFMNTFMPIGTSFNHSQGIAGEMPMTPGTASLIVLFVYLIIILKKGFKEGARRENGETGLCITFCIVSLCLTTYFVPYTILADVFPVLKFPERVLQYPWRFLSMAGIFLAWLTCDLFKKIFFEDTKKLLFATGIAFIALWQGTSYMSSFLMNSNAYYVYQEGNLTTFEVSNAEYLPIGSEVEEFVNHKPIFNGEAIEMLKWEKEGKTTNIELRNLTSTAQSIDIPLLYYKGYEAVDFNGRQLSISKGEKGKISVVIPGGFEGKFVVYFREPWYWRLCEGISFVSFIFLIISLKKDNGLYKRQRKTNEKIFTEI